MKEIAAPKKIIGQSAKLQSGTIHRVPADLKSALVSSTKVSSLWNSLTPLARNEWICWVTIVKKADTRKEHITRLKTELLAGKRRPCCWPGCPHHRPDTLKYFSKRSPGD